jgi:DNA-binding SARP family transcriptional activator
MGVRVRVLGPVTVARGDGELAGRSLGGGRERRLLTVLAVADGAVVARDALIDAVWDRPPKDPSAALDTTVSLLRRALGPVGGIVVTTHRGYRLAADTDVGELGRHERAGRWDAALVLLDRELAAGDRPNLWIESRRSDLARRRVDALAGAAASAAARGDDDAALACWSQVLADDRLREDAHRGLIAALARLGRPAEALRVYEHCRRAIREDLGCEPAPETVALHEQVLAGDLPGRPVATPTRRGELPFLGRRRELARLVSGGPGAVWAVVGEPGIGKSRLVAEALAARGGVGVRRTACFRLTAGVPFAALSDLAPELVEPDATPAGVAPEARAAHLADRWSEADERPAVVVIDDLQWADEPSLLVLGLVLRRQADLRVLVTVRRVTAPGDSPATRFLELAERLDRLEVVDLGPLTPAEVAPVGIGYDEWRLTGGHPLLMDERHRGGTSADLAALVLDRARAAGPTAVELLRAAAVIGRAADVGELAAVARLDPASARRAATRLADDGLLLSTGGAWRTRHEIIAELVRQDLLPAVRRDWHRRALAVLTASGAGAAELARHAEAAEDWPAALRHNLDAGDRAAASYANTEAVARYRAAGEAIELHAVGDDEDRRRAVLGHVRALLVLGRPSAARPLLAELSAGAGPQEVERLLAEALVGWTAWKPSQALGPALRALSTAQQLGDDELLARVHAFIANPYGSLGQLEAAEHHVEAAVELYHRLGQPVPALLWYRRSLLLHHTGRERAALAALDRCHRAARQQCDERAQVFERLVRAWTLGALGRIGEALSALDDIDAIGHGEEAVARSRVPNTRGSLYAELGLIDRALDADEESLEIARAQGSDAVIEPQVQSLVNLAWDHLRLGHPDQARRHLAEAAALSVDAEYARFRYANRMQWVEGLLALEAGDLGAALSAADTVEALARRYNAPKNHVRALLLRGEALSRRRGDREAAAAVLREGIRRAERHGFAALAEQGHRAASLVTGSERHLRRAERWRVRITASVDEPLRSALARAPDRKVAGR